VLFRYFMAVDMQRYNVLAQNCALAVSVALNLVLIPRYGVAGAAVASVVSAGVESIIVIEAFRRQSGRGVRELLVPRRSDLDVFVLRAARLVRRVLMRPGTASDPASGE
jgi:O-antigen/teichoic acid export membrane protein